MSRAITFVALLQTLLVIVGFVALGIVLKMAGYPDDITVRWNPLAVFLREHGAWLLLLPVFWVFFATPAERLDRGVFTHRIALIIGISVAGLIVSIFLYSAVFPYTRPILFHAP